MLNRFFEITPQNNQNLWLKAIVHPNTWSGHFGAAVTLRYSFGDKFAPKQSGEILVDVTAENRAAIKKAFDQWSSIANVNFIEDNKAPDLYICTYMQTPESYKSNFYISGYANLPPQKPVVMGFNVNNPSRLIDLNHVYLHEIGHIMGLDHPFESPHSHLFKHYQNYTSYSVMNYVAEINYNKTILIPLTPMPADYAAAQFIYGSNLETGLGDNVYELNNFIKHLPSRGGRKHASIATLPWDNGGTDTLSAASSTSDTVINLRRYHRSVLGHSYIVMPGIDIENVVSSLGNNKIILNPLNNIVDITHSLSTVLYVDPSQSGQDIVMGFNTTGDLLFLENDAIEPDYICSLASPGKFSLFNREIIYKNGTTVSFGRENYMTFINVAPDEMCHRIMLKEVHPDSAHRKLHYQDVFNDPEAQEIFAIQELPQLLGESFLSGMAKGASFSIVLSMLNNMLAQVSCPEDTRRVLMFAIQCGLFIQTKSYDMIVVMAAAHLLYDDELANFVCSSLMVAKMQTDVANTAAINLTTYAINNGAATIGGMVGSRFGIWAYNKIAAATDSVFNYVFPSKGV